jgi:hypothetical protein
MKSLFFSIVLFLYVHSSFSQECKIDTNPLPPHRDFVGSKSVGLYDIVKFYSFPDSSNHMLYVAVISDVFRRISNSGDSAVIILKNNHKIKLVNLRQFMYKFDKMNFGLVTLDMYPVTFMAWITKNDVEQMTLNTIKNVRYFIPIEDNQFVKNVIKPNKKEKLYLQPTLGFTHKKRIKKLANCALTL